MRTPTQKSYLLFVALLALIALSLPYDARAQITGASTTGSMSAAPTQAAPVVALGKADRYAE